MSDHNAQEYHGPDVDLDADVLDVIDHCLGTIDEPHLIRGLRIAYALCAEYGDLDARHAAADLAKAGLWPDKE